MKFTKYETMGAYHWELYKLSPVYKNHVDKVVNWVVNWVKGNILDIGAGDGLLTHKMGATGIDNDPTAIKLAKEKGADVILGDAYSLPYKDNEFENITMLDVLEHFEYPVRALLEAKRVLREHLYIVTPLKRERMDKFHYQEWSESQLIELVKGCGFKLIELNIVPEVNTQYAKFKI